MNKQIVSRSAVGAPVEGFPVATRAGSLLFVSGRMGLGREDGFPLAGYAELGRRPVPSLGLLAPDSWEEQFVAQASRMYEDLEILLAEHGAAKTDLLFYSIYMRDMRNFSVIARTRAALFPNGVAPPSTASQVPGLLRPDAVVYFDPLAVVPDPAAGLRKEVLSSRHVVQGPLSNYELATRVGPHTFYAGVVGARPESGLIVRRAADLPDPRWPRPEGGLAERLRLEPISGQTWLIHRLMHDMLAEHGSSPDRLLRLNVYLRDMAELPETERIARHFYPGARPAATVIGVDSLARRDFLIEIEGITCAAGEIVRAPHDPHVASWGPYADAVRGGDLIFVSGLLGYDPAAQRVVGGPADLGRGGAERVERVLATLPAQTRGQLAAVAQTRSILDQLAAVLGHLDARLAGLLKITVHLRDMTEFEHVRRVLLDALGDDPPAITAFAVPDLPLPGARVQIEAVAL